jgi:hypothetical protein
MSEAGKPATREERLAAQLRANLRKRKEQARAIRSEGDSTEHDEPKTDLPKP